MIIRYYHRCGVDFRKFSQFFVRFYPAGRTPTSESNKPSEASCAVVSSLRHSRVDPLAFPQG